MTRSLKKKVGESCLWMALVHTDCTYLDTFVIQAILLRLWMRKMLMQECKGWIIWLPKITKDKPSDRSAM